MTKQELTGRVYAPCEAKLDDDGRTCGVPVKITTEIRKGAPVRCEKHPIAPVQPIWPGAGEPTGIQLLKDTRTDVSDDGLLKVAKRISALWDVRDMVQDRELHLVEPLRVAIANEEQKKSEPKVPYEVALAIAHALIHLNEGRAIQPKSQVHEMIRKAVEAAMVNPEQHDATTNAGEASHVA